MYNVHYEGTWLCLSMGEKVFVNVSLNLSLSDKRLFFLSSKLKICRDFFFFFVLLLLLSLTYSLVPSHQDCTRIAPGLE